MFKDYILLKYPTNGKWAQLKGELEGKKMFVTFILVNMSSKCKSCKIINVLKNKANPHSHIHIGKVTHTSLALLGPGLPGAGVARI